ncbi:hypothetical protein K2173_021387 [Erythroxylum novogranatense]|uniref:Pentatricopeptide repeat-containing protein n=1 Tax=Erythroxylum novogranatense TaxID=1862640 RepID=A0AAV8TUX8_9ROSI|nr:hypothetical protein K2173_021387 [Erythroxylum novogranatense]
MANGILSTESNLKYSSLLKLNHILQLCSNYKALRHGLQVHQRITVCGWHQNPFLSTKLLQVYADCDHFIFAQKLFGEMPHQNVFAWTSLLGYYIRHGMYERCIRNYGVMKFKGVSPDNYVFPKVLRACAQLLWWEGGTWLHRDVIVLGCEFNSQVSNSLIDMYVKCKDIRSARWVFEKMERRDLLSWNLMISGFVYHGLLQLAIELSSGLRFDGLKPDLVTLNTLMDAYCRMGLCDEAWRVFTQIEDPSVISWTTLISGYSRIGYHETSLRIFKEMVNAPMIFPDVDCLSTVIVCCRYLNALMNGKEIHGYGIKTEHVTAFYSSAGAALVTMYAKCGRIRDAKKVFNFMDKSELVAWNAMIFGYVELDMGNMALTSFTEMRRLGVEYDQTTVSTVLPICDLACGKQIHAYIKKNCLCLVIPVCNALIHMYYKCGCIRSACSVFYSMASMDVVSWNTMIGGYAMHGLGKVALQIFQDMSQSGCCPNSMTFTSLLSACSHSGLVDEGLNLFYRIPEEYGLTPRMEHYSCVVDMLARAGQLGDALSFIERMPQEPDKSIWGTLLAACRAHQNLDIGKHAAEQLTRLEPEHAGHYVALSNIYAKAGRWDDAVRVRKNMEGKGLIKPSGESWIEIGK